MAIVTYDSIAPHVAPYAVACPTPVITDAMRKAAIEFYDRSTAYRAWLPTFDLTASTADYTLSGFPSETELAQLLENRMVWPMNALKDGPPSVASTTPS